MRDKKLEERLRKSKRVVEEEVDYTQIQQQQPESKKGIEEGDSVVIGKRTREVFESEKMSDSNSGSSDSGGMHQKTHAQAPVLCNQGCGFYGSASTLNMCSKCFREKQKVPSSMEHVEASAAIAAQKAAAETILSKLSPSVGHDESLRDLKEQQDTKIDIVKVGVESPGVEAEKVDSRAASSGEVLEKKEEQGNEEVKVEVKENEVEEEGNKRKIQKNKGRCFECRKKVGLTGFTCRCGFVYCGEHRYADRHECEFDYKSHAKDQLIKANPLVVAAKLEKI
eukprot:CAMPEP_0182441976 /NCGR_PEP_ID=MMETSP1172-20130603/944_1 /TAXON_ID=708627 /ORGANISM="Timspurckia oligopyrenoides, Strain CCMP3278" /LENGTH=280 /DNA_ID=CAMNT_0024636607 /DNA_START=97 /DNA_END=939 /DNA_ORIENTATION=+